MNRADEILWTEFVSAAFGDTDHAQYMLHDGNPAERCDMIRGLRRVIAKRVRAERPNAQPAKNAPWAEAFVDGNALTIRVKVEVLQHAMRLNPRDDSYAGFKVTDAVGFAHDVCCALNEEDEDGTSAIHLLLDAAIAKAIDDGSACIEEIRAEREARKL